MNADFEQAYLFLPTVSLLTLMDDRYMPTMVSGMLRSDLAS